MEHRFAFAAQYWGDGAVVCRAVFDRPGPVVEPQFGEFKTWTQAQNFATKLNEGLDLDPLEVRKVVTSSILASACVIQEALNSKPSWTGSPVEADARAAQLRLLLSELALALTLCRCVAHGSQAASARRIVERARRVVNHSSHFLGSCDGDSITFQRISAQTQKLNGFVQRIAACLDNDSGSLNDPADPMT